MTEFQLDTFTQVKSIKQQIQEELDPTTFTLNKKIVELQQQWSALQDKCQHIYDEHGVCSLCGKVKE